MELTVSPWELESPCNCKTVTGLAAHDARTLQQQVGTMCANSPCRSGLYITVAASLLLDSWAILPVHGQAAVTRLLPAT